MVQTCTHLELEGLLLQHLQGLGLLDLLAHFRLAAKRVEDLTKQAALALDLEQADGFLEFLCLVCLLGRLLAGLDLVEVDPEGLSGQGKGELDTGRLQRECSVEDFRTFCSSLCSRASCSAASLALKSATTVS